MSTVANFPGRRNERRIRALSRIERQIASGVKRWGRIEEPLTAGDRNRLGREADALALRIRPHDALRAIRTKKLKADGWTAARTAWRRGKLA
jgi:hypothetical protein